MTTSSSSSVSTAATHVVGQYNEAGKTLVSAYRNGVHRLLDAAASRTGDLLGKRTLPLMDDTMKARVLGAQEKVNGFLARRLDIDTSRVVHLMDRVATGATNGIASVAGAADRVESPIGASMIKTLGSLHMPLATLSVVLADRVAEGAKQIETRVSGEHVAKVAKVVKSVRAKAATRRPVRTVRKA